MPPNSLRRWLRQVPFQPFEVHVTDGSVYLIHHPDLVIVGLATMQIGLFADPAREREVEIALMHVTRLEPIVPG
jgi:hypothetical protein